MSIDAHHIAPASSRPMTWGQRALLTVTALFLGVVIAAPIALSSQDLVAWAGSPSGLGLESPWDVFTFIALDLAAFVCVCMVVYAAWRGESGGLFGVLVWVFAAASAYANYRHGTRPGAPDDAYWFFPAMSLAGPALLEVTVRRIRRWVQTSAGRYEHPLPHFRLARWLIAMRETWRAWKLAVTEGYSRPEDAITAARSARPAPTPERLEERDGRSDVGLHTLAPIGRRIHRPDRPGDLGDHRDHVRPGDAEDDRLPAHTRPVLPTRSLPSDGPDVGETDGRATGWASVPGEGTGGDSSAVHTARVTVRVAVMRTLDERGVCAHEVTRGDIIEGVCQHMQQSAVNVGSVGNELTKLKQSCARHPSTNGGVKV